MKFHNPGIKKQKEFDGMTTELSNACDDAIEIRDEIIKKTKQLQQDKEAATVANERVAEIMILHGMETCKHAGLTFKVKEPPQKKPKVIIKEEKGI